MQAPITAIPEAIANLPSLERLDIYGTKVAHLPHALAQMPTVVALSIGHSPFESPEELAKMPWLDSASRA